MMKCERCGHQYHVPVGRLQGNECSQRGCSCMMSTDASGNLLSKAPHVQSADERGELRRERRELLYGPAKIKPPSAPETGKPPSGPR